MGQMMATLQLNVPRVRQYMDRQGWSERELAGHMDVAYSYINRVLTGKRGVGARAIAGFRKAGLNWDEILVVVED